jgi:glycosyltransferase involved in cell wall biosynthesis
MQYGLPVVSTDEGAIPSMVIDGETGWICPRKNVDALVNSIEKLLIDKELCKQMGEKGRLRYKERYTVEAFEKKFMDILSEILN